MDLSPDQLVVTLNEVIIQDGGLGVGFTHVPAHTTGVVQEVAGSYPQQALVRFNVDGEDVQDWIDSDELLPR